MIGRLLRYHGVSLSRPASDAAQTPERHKPRALLNPSYVNTAFPSRSGCRRRTGYDDVRILVEWVLALCLTVPPPGESMSRSQYPFSLCIDGELIFSKRVKNAFV